MRVARLLLPLALIALCLALAGGASVLDRLVGASPGWLALSVLLLHLVTLLSALRWRLVAAALGLPLAAGAAVREYYLAQFVNQTLPGGVLGDVARAARSRQGGALLPAAQAVVLERAAGQMAMAGILALGLALALAGPGDGLAALDWRPAAALGLMVAALGALALGRARRPDGWRAAMRQALLRRLPVQAALSIAVAALTVGGFAAAARATGTTLAPAAAALVVPLILTAMLLPASVAGWGWREGAAAALFPLAGASPAAGLAASIAFGAAMLAAALPGAFCLHRPASTRRGRKSVASPPE